MTPWGAGGTVGTPLLVAGKRPHDCRYPVPNRWKAEFVFLHGFRNKLMGFERLYIQVMAVHSEQNVSHDKPDALIPVDGGVVVCEGFHQSGCLLNQIAVV